MHFWWYAGYAEWQARFHRQSPCLHRLADPACWCLKRLIGLGKDVLDFESSDANSAHILELAGFPNVPVIDRSKLIGPSGVSWQRGLCTVQLEADHRQKLACANFL